nr:unnamed protein product [Digitaria exilis]
MSQSCRESSHPVRGSSGAWELAAAICLKSARCPPHAAVLLPLAEARACLRLAALLCRPPPPSAVTKVHLELALLILSPLPSGPPRLKLHAHSHLAGAYAIMGAAQLAPALTVDGDMGSALSAVLVEGAAAAYREPADKTLLRRRCTLHPRIHLLCCEDSAAVESSVAQATQVGDAFPVL